MLFYWSKNFVRVPTYSTDKDNDDKVVDWDENNNASEASTPWSPFFLESAQTPIYNQKTSSYPDDS